MSSSLPAERRYHHWWATRKRLRAPWVVVETVKHHNGLDGVEPLGNDVTVGDQHERREVRVEFGTCDEEPGADALVIDGLDRATARQRCSPVRYQVNTW